jgi:hypothetical protein
MAAEAVSLQTFAIAVTGILAVWIPSDKSFFYHGRMAHGKALDY